MESVRGVRLVWWVCGCCMLALLTIIICAFVRGWTPATVERAVRAALPPESDRASIEAFLDGHGWRRSYATDVSRLYAERAGLRDVAGRTRAMIFGEVSEPNVGPLDEGRITVMFFLDENDRLIQSHVSVWIMSL